MAGVHVAVGRGLGRGRGSGSGFVSPCPLLPLEEGDPGSRGLLVGVGVLGVGGFGPGGGGGHTTHPSPPWTPTPREVMGPIFSPQTNHKFSGAFGASQLRIFASAPQKAQHHSGVGGNGGAGPPPQTPHPPLKGALIRGGGGGLGVSGLLTRAFPRLCRLQSIGVVDVPRPHGLQHGLVVRHAGRAQHQADGRAGQAGLAAGAAQPIHVAGGVQHRLGLRQAVGHQRRADGGHRGEVRVGWARKGKEPPTKPGWAEPRPTARPPCSVNRPGHHAGAHATRDQQGARRAHARPMEWWGAGGVDGRYNPRRSGAPTKRSDPTQHAKGRTGDCPGPCKGTTTRRNVTRGVRGQKQVCVPKIDFQFRAPLIEFIFPEEKFSDVGGGAGSGGGAQAAIPPHPVTVTFVVGSLYYICCSLTDSLTASDCLTGRS